MSFTFEKEIQFNKTTHPISSITVQSKFRLPKKSLNFHLRYSGLVSACTETECINCLHRGSTQVVCVTSLYRDCMFGRCCLLA